jgi:FKBP-type peptidyl-prolyl cis-trans isomerase FklB
MNLLANGRLLSAGLSLVVLVCGCRRTPKTNKLGDDPKDRESYGLGYQLGTSLKNQHTSVNLDAYVAGLREALAGTESQVSTEERRTAVSELRSKALAAQQAGSKDRAEKNRAAGQAFLEENKSKEGVVVLPSGVQYRVLTEGSGRPPSAGDTVAVNYRSSLVDGTEFANSYKQRRPVTISLARVIPGWREALLLMKEGSKWQIFIPSDLAYGPKGGSGIEPNSTLVFEVELLHVASADEHEVAAAQR